MRWLDADEFANSVYALIVDRLSVMKCIGFLINPIAGMGGRVGLKGTDGMVDRARALGAEPVAPSRALAALTDLKHLLSGTSDPPPVQWLTCSGEMGEACLLACGFAPGEIEVVHVVVGEPAVGDTIAAARQFVQRGADLVLFCGGDGTARDICKVVGLDVPILGIPSGVKMYSGVFGANPRRTADVAAAFLQGRLTASEADVLDVDEAQYRADAWNVRLYYSALTLFEPILMQSAKAVIEQTGEAEIKEAIADYLCERNKDDPGRLMLLGPGSTVQTVAKRWGIEKTLLGIDAVVDGRCVARDLNERQLLELLDNYTRRELIISPIGAQGFVLGRGNLQLSPNVIRAIGRDNITIIATPGKLARTPVLRFDTGDRALDDELTHNGHVFVVTGYGRRRVVKVAA